LVSDAFYWELKEFQMSHLFTSDTVQLSFQLIVSSKLE